MAYALMTGTFIAAYTLWDKQAVSRFAVSPILLDWGANLGRSLLLTPFALRHWKKRAQRMADPSLWRPLASRCWRRFPIFWFLRRCSLRR